MKERRSGWWMQCECIKDNYPHYQHMDQMSWMSCRIPTASWQSFAFAMETVISNLHCYGSLGNQGSVTKDAWANDSSDERRLERCSHKKRVTKEKNRQSMQTKLLKRQVGKNHVKTFKSLHLYVSCLLSNALGCLTIIMQNMCRDTRWLFLNVPAHSEFKMSRLDHLKWATERNSDVIWPNKRKSTSEIHALHWGWVGFCFRCS